MFVGADGTLTFIDWGMVGTLSGRDQDTLMKLVAAFASGNDTLLLSALLDLAPPRRRLDKQQLRVDVGAFVDKLRARLEDIRMADLAEDLQAMSRRHSLSMPASISILLRVLAVSDGLVRTLDPNLSMLEVATHHAGEYLKRKLQPDKLLGWLEEQVGEQILFTHDLPAQLRRILDRAESGEIDVNVRDDVLTASLDRVERITNRLTTGMLVSAGMIASTLLLLARKRRRPS